MFITGKIVNVETCRPIEGVVLDLWHADHFGKYDVDYSGHDRGIFKMRGRLRTDAEGKFRFRSVVPTAYGPGRYKRPAHVHYKVSADGYESLTTQMYFAGDEYLDRDPIRNVRDQLIVTLDEHPNGKELGDPSIEKTCYSGLFDIALQPKKMSG